MTLPFSCRAREVTCHYGHVLKSFLLLTYLLTYLSVRSFVSLSRQPCCSPAATKKGVPYVSSPVKKTSPAKFMVAVGVELRHP